MPRRKLVRRFEPRYGVSAEMLEVEGTYVARERSDYQLLSLVELREKLGTVGKMYGLADEVLQKAIRSLPEREQLAVRGLITRDLYLILELYCTHLRIASGAAGTTVRTLNPAPTKASTPQQVTPFSEWLFAT